MVKKLNYQYVSFKSEQSLFSLFVFTFPSFLCTQLSLDQRLFNIPELANQQKKYQKKPLKVILDFPKGWHPFHKASMSEQKENIFKGFA